MSCSRKLLLPLLLLPLTGCATEPSGAGMGPITERPADAEPEGVMDDEADDDVVNAGGPSSSSTATRDAAVAVSDAALTGSTADGGGSAPRDAGGVSSDASQGPTGLPDAGRPASDAGPARDKLKLWIAGDSTVMSYPASAAPQEGWGQELAPFFSARVSVDNQALGGRSTRTFMFGNVTCTNGQPSYTGGKPEETGTRWERIRKGLVAGDYLLIQFGHNDGGGVCERHVELPEFQQNLSTMVRVARERGATPILITPMSQLSYKDGVFRATLTDYAAAMKKTAASEQVELVDLNTLSVEYYRSKGHEFVANQVFLVGETTHFQKNGALAMAKLIVDALRDDMSALAAYLE